MRWFPPRTPLSAHFAWDEVIHNSGYARVPLGPTYIGLGRFVLTPRRNARRHAANLERVRAKVNEQRRPRKLAPIGIRALSWARSYAHNKAVGGARNSQHLYFHATDFDRAEIELLLPWDTGRLVFDAILEDVFNEGGVGRYPAGNRHCDSRGRRARWTHA